MATTVSREFPASPLTVREVLGLKKRVDSFFHVAPLIGLHAVETGQAAESQAVVGAYVALESGARLVGFDPKEDTWGTAIALSPDDVQDPATVASGMDDLMAWITERYPGEKLVVYDREDPRSN